MLVILYQFSIHGMPLHLRPKTGDYSYPFTSDQGQATTILIGINHY